MSLTGFGFSDSAALLKHYKYSSRHVVVPSVRPMYPLSRFTVHLNSGGTLRNLPSATLKTPRRWPLLRYVAHFAGGRFVVCEADIRFVVQGCGAG
jgi:hypothetical protein